MSRIRIPVIGSAAAAVLLSPLALAAPAQAATAALTVNAIEDWQGETQVTIWVSNGSLVGPGDLVITDYQKNRWRAFHVYLDPESGSQMTLAAGGGCSPGTPSTLPPMPAGTSLLCDYVEGYSTVRVNLSGSTYEGGEFTVTNTLSVPASFHGSEFADYFQGGPGKDSFDGAGGDDVIFGGDGNDWILGGDGADRLDGEGGQDVIFGDAGPDDITGDGDAKAGDYINCNNMDPAVVNTDNDPDNPPINTVSFDGGFDRITDCGLPGAPGATTPPSLSGTPSVDSSYTAKAGTWTGKALIMSYTWFSCPAPDDTVPILDEEPTGSCREVQSVDGAQGLTYVPTAKDLGTYLRLVTTARNNSGFWTEVTAASPAVVPSLLPGKPVALKAWLKTKTVLGKTRYSLWAEWKAPAVPAGAPANRYVLQISTDQGKSWNMTFDVAAPRRGNPEFKGNASSDYKKFFKNFLIRVAAKNAAGDQGPWSKAVKVTQP